MFTHRLAIDEGLALPYIEILIDKLQNVNLSIEVESNYINNCFPHLV
jgi:hypothetical protein